MNHWFFLSYHDHRKPLLLLTVLLVVAGHAYNYFTKKAYPEPYAYGFYEAEAVNGAKMRWTWKRACLRQRMDTHLMALTVYTEPYNIGESGLVLRIFINDRLLDSVHILESGLKPLYYYIPSFKGKEITLETKVSETFNPYRLGLSRDIRKNREQGVAVSSVTFLRIMPLDGVGFYDWESWDGKKGRSWPEDIPPKFRWTGMRASMNMQRELKKGDALFLMCAHPDIDKDPVIVDIICNDDIMRSETFTDNRWKKVAIKAEEVKGSKALTFRVSRTWNPRLTGISDDGRDLGVAVAIY